MYKILLRRHQLVRDNFAWWGGGGGELEAEEQLPFQGLYIRD